MLARLCGHQLRALPRGAGTQAAAYLTPATSVEPLTSMKIGLL
jgi:hypothetical protein